METRLLGTGKEVLIGAGHPFCPIGERINPTNKPRLTRAIKEGNWGHLQRMARRQVRAGAKVVDINVGVPGADEAEAMRSAVRAIQEVIDVPISIDSSTIDVLLAGLEVAEGRPLVNSVPAEETYMKRLLPAIKDRDVAMIGMCMRGGANMPTTVEERLQIARTLLDEADKHGIASEDVIIDVLILPIGADHGTGLTTLQSIEQVATELGNNTSVGLSNLSFGMPDRQFFEHADARHVHSGRSDGGNSRCGPDADPDGDFGVRHDSRFRRVLYAVDRGVPSAPGQTGGEAAGRRLTRQPSCPSRLARLPLTSESRTDSRLVRN